MNPVVKLPPMAAVIYHNNSLIGWGFNSTKTHPLMKQFSKRETKVCVHAEIAAIAFASRSLTREQLAECSIYVARAHKKLRTPALAKPCPICQGALEVFGIRNVYWTE